MERLVFGAAVAISSSPAYAAAQSIPGKELIWWVLGGLAIGGVFGSQISKNQPSGSIMGALLGTVVGIVGAYVLR